MKTLKEVLKLSTDYLEGQNVSFSRRVAEEIISSVLRISRVDIYMEGERRVRDREWQSCLVYLRRKITGEPLEYLLRRVEFYHCQIEVNQSVLIPRQESEILLMKACQRIKQKGAANKVAWDICTGSGCLGISLKKAIPNLQVTLSDICKNCVNVAQRNALRNSMEVEIRSGDLLTPFNGEKADFILCNPPYVSAKEFETLSHNVKNFEPAKALLGGPTGLEFYQRLAEGLPRYLNSGGLVCLEIGAQQKLPLLQIFNSNVWKSVVCEQDWSGKDRFFFLEKG